MPDFLFNLIFGVIAGVLWVWSTVKLTKAKQVLDRVQSERSTTEEFYRYITPGSYRIAMERHRHFTEEKWSSEHDDAHNEDQLVRAAACYLLTGRKEPAGWYGTLWPWGSQWWKPSPEDRVRELTKAGALIAAEIDRIDRITRKGRKP